MLRLGIFRLDEYRPEPSGWLDRLRWMVNRHRISLQLLRTGIPPSTQEIAVFEALMLGLRLNSGVYRTTFHRRFADLDRFVNDLLLERVPSTAALNIQDWAASDCLTSSEWAASLFPLFPNARLEASDLTLFLVEVNNGGDTLIMERDGQPLQYVGKSFLVNMNRPEQRPRVLTGMMLAHARSVISKLNSHAIPAEWLDSDSDSLTLPPCMVRKLPMIHPEAALFRARNSRFSISRHSVFEPLSQPADVIRSMNIYNLTYFDTPQLAAGVKAVWSSLKPGGLWIVGRTWRENPPAHNVSIFERMDAGFELVRQYGDGSEIDPIILGQTRTTLAVG